MKLCHNPALNSNIKCKHCSKDFLIPTRAISYGKGVFCSENCRISFSSIEVSCEHCGTVFRKKLNQIGQRKQSFCTHECYGKFRSKNLVAENSPQWKGGLHMKYGGQQWKQQRKKAIYRDDNTCQDCSTKSKGPAGRNLDVHHIIEYDLFEDKNAANDLSNLITLCRKCHTKRHKNEIEKN